MSSGNKRARDDADAVIENNGMSKRARDDADVAAQTPLFNQKESAKVEAVEDKKQPLCTSDESFYDELEVALEKECKGEEEREAWLKRHGKVEKEHWKV